MLRLSEPEAFLPLPLEILVELNLSIGCRMVVLGKAKRILAEVVKGTVNKLQDYSWPHGGNMTHNADGSILIGDNIIVRRSRLPGVFVIANDEDETFIEKQYVEELIQALQILRFGQ